MSREQGSEFSGISGRVLSGAISGGSLFSGMVIGLVLLIVNWMLLMAGAHPIAMVFTLGVLAATTARYAVNGMYGEWSGTVFSSVGGPWTTVATVTLRYVALTCTWYVPLTLLGLAVGGSGEAQSPSPLGALAANRGALFVAALHMLGSVLTPPLFLIMALSARDFSDLFASDAWRRRFAGRRDDVVSVYAVYAGGLCTVALVSAAVVILAAAISFKLAVFIGALAFCLVFGVSVNLLGRLCGFFVCAEPTSGHGTDSVGAGDTPPAADDPPVPTPGASAASATPVIPASTTPVLLEAKPRVDQAVARFADDPSGTLEELRRLRDDFAPHPLVLKALAICAYRKGRVEEAVETAALAIPLCIERGQAFLAAELFRELRQQRAALGLKREQLLATGNALVMMEEYAIAAKAYTAVIGTDPEDTQAIKGLLGVAEAILHKLEKPEAAVKVYRLLLQQCSTSPLAEFMRDGQQECERRIAQTSVPSR